MRNLKLALGLVALIISAGTVTGHEATKNGVTVAHAWARATPGGATVGAAYLEIKTDDKTTDKLVSVSTPVAGRPEIHTHIMEGDVMKMRKVEAIALKPGESHVLKPMGDHLMLMDLKQPLKEGDLIKLTLTFEKAGALEIDATVEPAGATGPHGLDHQPTADDDAGKKSTEHQH